MPGLHSRLKALRARGLHGRAIAEYLGLHESTVSRLLKDPGRAERFFQRHPNLLERLASLEEEADGYLRRWRLARLTARLLRTYPWLSAEKAEELALALLERERP